MIAQALAQGVPGLAGFERLGRARKDLDRHLGDDRQAIVRSIVLEPRNAVAEGIEVLVLRARRRIELERVLEAALIGELARLQVQQVMRMGDVAAVLVHRRVAHRVAHHADTAPTS